MANQQENVPLVPPEVRIPIEPNFLEFRAQVQQNRIEQRYLVDSFLNDATTTPILLLACQGGGGFANVLPETIKLLIDSGANLYYIDHQHYGWEPLHYAAAATNPTRLQAVCDRIRPDEVTSRISKLVVDNRINSLTALSENALHVLLSHGATSSTFTISCQNGKDFKLTNIINREHEDIVECARILIKKDIDVNHPNFWNETPIIVAIKRKYFQVVQLLLEKNVDLDGCRDAVGGKTARELLNGRHFNLATSTTTKSSSKILFELLKSGDEDAFLKFNGGNLRDFRGSLDGDTQSTSSCTLLQYCFRRSLIFWYQEKHEWARSEDVTDGMVEVFCKSGAKCVLHLLEQGVRDVQLPKFEDGRTVLEAAITKGFYPFVALILDKLRDSELPMNTICDALLVLIETNHGVDLNNTLSVVLARLEGNVTCHSTDVLKKLSLLLERGAKNKKINTKNQLLLLKFPGSLSWTCENSSKPPRSVLGKVDPEVLKTHLDNCVTQKSGDVVINCTSFTCSSLPSLLELYLSPPLSELLKHVVFKIFIKRQWNNLKPQWKSSFKYVYLNLYYYSVFYMVLNTYILAKFEEYDLGCIIFFWFVSLICLLLFVTKEVVQIRTNLKMFHEDNTNYIELFFIVVTTLALLWPFLFTPPFSSYSTWSDVFEVLTVLSSNVVFLGLLTTLPAFVRYMIILRTIKWYFRYLFFYLIHFLAFSICFYILFTKTDEVGLGGFANKFFYTVILFTGNLDYMETPWKTESNTTTLYHETSYNEFFAKVIFITFVFFLAIILQNLFLGLLAFDISNLQKEVAVAEQLKSAGFIVRADKIMKSSLMVRIFGEFKHTNIQIKGTMRVVDEDRQSLSEEERQQLDFVLTRQAEEANFLKKVKSYIRKRVNERRCENGRKDKMVLEELIKKLQEMK